MITVAKNAGFCFGVRRATDTVEDLIKSESKCPVYILGKLIHNEQYSEYLRRNGVKEISGDDIDELLDKSLNGKRVTVVIRTHGVVRALQKKLDECKEKSPSFFVVDSTCPYVKKIHKIAEENSGKDEIFVVIGQREHPEVESIVSYARGRCEVFPNDTELEKFLSDEKNAQNSINIVL